MPQTFTKQFNSNGQFISLPNNSYWLSREEAILSYLHQRKASVPRVQLKNLLNNELILENVGYSLAELLKNNKDSPHDENSIIAIVLNTIIALEEIFNLGVLHLDIALRNIASPNLRSEKVFILDFSHSLSLHNKLQKPIPLIPTESLHHPLLINSLSNDWKNYFSYFSIRNQKIDSTLVISDEEFTEYWPQSLNVQDLSTNKAVLCHGIANLLNEISIASSCGTYLNKYFLEISHKLRFLKEEDADFALSDVINNLKDKKKFLTVTKAEGTPIPNISFNTSDRANDGILIKESGIPSNIRMNATNKELPFDIEEKRDTKSNKFISGFTSEMIIWVVLALNGWWINLIIDTAKIHLSDNLITSLIIGSFICLIFFGSSFFINPPKNIFLRVTTLLIACLAELLLILSYTNNILSHFFLWIPSALIISMASIFLISTVIMHLVKQPN